MPNFKRGDGAVKVAMGGPSGAAKPVLGASHDSWLDSISIGADEDAVLEQFHCRAFDGYHNMRPLGSVKVAGIEVFARYP